MRRGMFSAFMAYFLWGILPLFWKLLSTISASEIILHRVIWSAVFLVIIVALRQELSSVYAVFKNPKHLILFTVSGLLIGSNWLLYIYSVLTNQTTEASLGYYICPLVTVVLAHFFLHEKLSKLQWFAFALALIGVAVRIYTEGVFPLIGIVLAVSFALYGLVRKKLSFDSITGLTVETLLLTPFALIALFLRAHNGTLHFLLEPQSTLILLIGAGIVTSLPLLFYGYGIKHTPFSIVGFLQFVGPTLQLAIALFIFHEPTHPNTLLPFIIIWIGVILFIFDSFRRKV